MPKSPKGFQKWLNILRSWLAIQGGVLAWTGAWLLLDLHIGPRGESKREWAYVGFGLTLLLFSNTYVPASGVGQLRLRKNERGSGYQLIIFTYLRSCVAWLGLCTLWVGVYNLVDVHAFADLGEIFEPNTPQKDIVTLTVGILLMLLTNTYLAEGGLQVYLEYDGDCAATIGLYVKATGAHLGSVCYWIGSWNLWSYYIFPEETILRDATLVLIGLVVLVATDTLARHAGLTYSVADSSAQLPTRNWKQWASVYARSTVAMTAGMWHWVGWWGLFSRYIGGDAYNVAESEEGATVDTTGRDAAYFSVGTFMLVVTGTLFYNSGIVTPLMLARRDVDTACKPTGDAAPFVVDVHLDDLESFEEFDRSTTRKQAATDELFILIL